MLTDTKIVLKVEKWKKHLRENEYYQNLTKYLNEVKSGYGNG